MKYEAIPERVRSHFMFINLSYLVKLISIFMNGRNDNPNMLERILTCCLKFMEIFSNTTVKQINEMNILEVYRQWLSIIFQLPSSLINSGLKINAENELYISSIAMMREMGMQVENLQINREREECI